MSWDKELQELNQRSVLADAMGGEEKVARQHHFGKLTIRERIHAIIDPNSFHEIGKLAGVGSYNDAGELINLVPSNFVLGPRPFMADPLSSLAMILRYAAALPMPRSQVNACRLRAWRSNSSCRTFG